MFAGVVVVLSVWFLGAYAYQFSCWKFAGIFGDDGNLENIFAPVNAFFSAVGVIGVVAAIIYQVVQYNGQSFENNFINLLNIHIKTRGDIVYPFDNGELNGQKTSRGVEAFSDYYKLYRAICSKYNGKFKSAKYCYLTKDMIDEINDYLSMLDNDVKSERDIFKISHAMFESYTEARLFHYYTELYRLLKYTKENAPRRKCRDCMRMIRANLSVFELAMIYYNALMIDDEENFKELIEKSELFDNLKLEILFDEGVAGSYKDAAFGNAATQKKECLTMVSNECTETVTK